MGPENQNRERSTKYLVVGSSGYQSVDCVDWNASSMPNIVDYDVVIIDVRSLDKGTLAAVSNERFEELRLSLLRLLDSQGQIIVLTDRIRIHKRPNAYPDIANNYSWCPITIGFSEESGDSIEVIEPRFRGFLGALNRWPYYLFTPKNALSRELTNYYGSTYKTRYRIPESPIVTNRYGKSIATIYRIEVTRERQGRGYDGEYYPDEPDSVTGEMVLLPLIESMSAMESVDAVLSDVIGHHIPAPAPAWAHQIPIPGSIQLETRIERITQRIDTQSAERQLLTNELDKLYDYRRILYSTGHDLEQILQVCLEALGGLIEPAKYGEEEYVLSVDGREHLMEVKGVQHSISLTHLRQLNDYVLRYEEDAGKPCKGILFGNSWRLTSPEERGVGDKHEFPDNVIKRAEQLGIALWSSVQFFDLYCKFLAEEFSGSEILHYLTQGTGYIASEDLDES